MRVAVVGAGALGIFISAMLAKAGRVFDVIDRNHENVAALRAQGARVIGSLSLEQKVNAMLPAEAVGPYDLIFLLTKQTSNQQTFALLKRILAPAGVVCTLQNGLPESALAEALGKARVMGGVVAYGCRRLGPGLAQLTGSLKVVREGGLSMGEINGQISPRLRAAADFLSAAGAVRLLDNLAGLRWSKLSMNASMGALSGICAATFGQVLENPKAMATLACLGHECVVIAKALGVGLASIQGFNFNGFQFAEPSQLEEKINLYRALWAGSLPATKISILHDLEAGRPSEAPYINGAVVSASQAAGLAAPFNEKALHLLEGPAKGLPGFILLEEFNPLLRARGL